MADGPTNPILESSGENPCPMTAVLELSDGSTFQGISFGAEGKSIAGECVFQTGQSTQR
jgi:carbamoyl-phosphate synthase / aspartate carbamoyltransferase